MVLEVLDATMTPDHRSRVSYLRRIKESSHHCACKETLEELSTDLYRDEKPDPILV